MEIDLHMHSYYSDGTLSPAELVQKCYEKGLKTIALTDHENVGGIPEAKIVVQKLGIKLIPGIEFTSGFQDQEHHILGYFIDCKSSSLKRFLTVWRKTKKVQIGEIIEKLRPFGLKTSLEEVVALAHGSLDRYHISLALFPDFCKSPVEGEKQSIFFRKFLLEKAAGGEGLAFAERKKPDIHSVIKVIHKSGGLAFWAHPFWKIKDEKIIRELALNFREMGLDGIETSYPYYTRERALFLHGIASDFSMYESAGSDFHRGDGSIRQLGNFQNFGIEINLCWISKGAA